MRDEFLYLEDIVNAANDIERFLLGIDHERFVNDEILQNAVLHKLMIVGEAASKLSPDFREKHPEINWKGIIGFRNVLVHAYFGVDIEIVWETAIGRLKVLQEQINPFLTDETWRIN